MPPLLQRFFELAGVLAPVVLLLALGFLLRRWGLLPQPGHQALSRLVFWVCLPALLIAKLSARELGALLSWTSFGIGALIFVVGFTVAMFATRSLAPEQRGSAVAGLARFNGAFVGLPVLAMLAGSSADPILSEQLLPSYLILLALLAPVTNALSIAGILLPLHGFGAAGCARVGVGLISNPVLIACVIGILLSLIEPGLLAGNWAGQSLSLLGEAAIPLALLTTGAAIELHLLRGRLALLGAISATRLLVMPAAAYALASLVGLEPVYTIGLVILLGCPTAASSVPLARELGGDEQLMADCVAATTVLAPLTLLLWLLVLG